MLIIWFVGVFFLKSLVPEVGKIPICFSIANGSILGNFMTFLRIIFGVTEILAVLQKSSTLKFNLWKRYGWAHQVHQIQCQKVWHLEP